MSAYNPYDPLPQVPSFEVMSIDVKDGEELPPAQRSAIFGVEGGQDVSPHLSWSGFPAETASFAVTMYDPDAPTASGFWHWAVANIPASVTELATGAASDGMPPGAIQLRNDAGIAGFLGAAPPVGHIRHRYFIVVHALSVEKLPIDENVAPALLGFNMFTQTLARATMVPWFQR